MTFVITQPCIDTQDQSCVEVCPVDCIHFEEGADRMLYISPVECIDCGACEPACPVDAIYPEADVPADQQAYTPINELWYTDPAAARAQVESLSGGAPAAAPAAAAASAAPAEEEPPATETSPEAAAAPATEPSSEAAPADEAPAAEPAAAAPVAAFSGAQVPATPLPAMVAAGGEPTHLSPLSFVALVAFAAAVYAIFVLPGPIALTFDGVDLAVREGGQFNIRWQGQVGITVLLVLPIALIALAMFMRSELRALASFAAHGTRRVAEWRWQGADWRRSEEMRRFNLEQTIGLIASERYAFPSAAHPELRAYVNLPKPQMALEFGAGGGEKVFPDIVVVRHPGNYPTMVVQVETRETLTREQALYVWSRLENERAPLDIYVPAGLASRARDYAKAAGIKHARFRTWRWQPQGITIREV